jgi:hypothetical protein
MNMVKREKTRRRSDFSHAPGMEKSIEKQRFGMHAGSRPPQS